MTSITLTQGSSTPVPTASFRDVVGAFCSGVVVVTSMDEEPLGFTCQSFTSLSLEPQLVSINPSRMSKTWPRIRSTGKFAINILARDQQHLSDCFARSGGDKFAAVSWQQGTNGAPVLDGVAAWLACDLEAECEGGDHTIAIGKVTAMDHDPSREPLVYYRGRYQALS